VANLTIRNLDAKVVENLKSRARANRRSLESEVRLLLEQYGRRPPPEELIRQAEEIAAMTPRLPQTDSATLVREGRDR
jgi:plasmid stability protein